MTCNVSIIVPIYNAENTLVRCLDSLRNQTLQDFEVIMIDDGSSDNCGMLIDNYAIIDDRFKSFHKENGGVHTARNKGIELCSGEFVALLDKDDLWAKNSITDDFIDKLLKDKCCFYKCSYLEVD